MYVDYLIWLFAQYVSYAQNSLPCTNRFLPARHYANAVFAVIASFRLSVCHKSMFYQN